MKTTSTLYNLRRKSSFALLALLLVLFLPIATSPVVMGFSGNNGNPYSNGTFFSNTGTFQTTIRGVNLSGVATFSTGDTTTTGTSSGNFAVSYKGLSYSGSMDASIDTAGGTIAATMEASVTRGGSGTASNTIKSSYEPTGTQAVSGGTSVVNLPDQTTTDTTIVSGGTGVTLQTTTVTVDNTGNVPPGGVVITTTTAPVTITLPDTVTPTTTTISGQTQTINNAGSTADKYGWVDTIANSTYVDTAYTSGSFTAKLKNSFPNQIFKGKGTMAFTAINFTLLPPVLETTKVAISVKGSRISDTAQTYTDQTTQAPSIITTTTVQNRTGSTNSTN